VEWESAADRNSNLIRFIARYARALARTLIDLDQPEPPKDAAQDYKLLTDRRDLSALCLKQKQTLVIYSVEALGTTVCSSPLPLSVASKAADAAFLPAP
jgi:hypothetical protein